jgi:hypothetical protein
MIDSHPDAAEAPPEVAVEVKKTKVKARGRNDADRGRRRRIMPHEAEFLSLSIHAAGSRLRSRGERR